jgi:6,7-dimethyl-8-ribityllumazine synthase
MLQTQNVDAVIAIGSVIQGETKHFDFVCEGVARDKRFECSNGYSCYFFVFLLTIRCNNQSIEVEEFMAIKELRLR